MCIAEGNADKANTFKDNKLPQGESRLWWSLIHTIVKEKGKKPYRNVNNMVIDEMRFEEKKCIDGFSFSSSDKLIESLRFTNYFPRKIYLAYVSTKCIECLSRMYIEDQGHSAYLAQTFFTYILGHILTYRPFRKYINILCS